MSRQQASQSGAPNLYWIPGGGSGERQSWKPSQPIRSRSQPIASWDPLGHWDVNDGIGGYRQRYDYRGNPISANNAHNNPHRRPKSGPGSFCGMLFGLIVGATDTLDATANSFPSIREAARNGASSAEIDDMMYDAIVDAAIERGNAGALPGLYGPWSWIRSLFKP